MEPFKMIAFLKIICGCIMTGLIFVAIVTFIIVFPGIMTLYICRRYKIMNDASDSYISNYWLTIWYNQLVTQISMMGKIHGEEDDLLSG